MKKISIIIPVYNAEKTIRRCLKSIMSSEYEEYEVIIVDDGSTDNSASILFEYANRDHRIKVINQSNSGPSLARNKGLELAKGDIITFIDSDDYVRKDYLDQLAKAFTEQDADVVFFEFHRVTPDGTELSTHHLPKIQTEYYQNLIALSEADMFGYTWIKAFRRGISHEMYFDAEINLFEDELFTCRLLEKTVKLYFLNEAIYYYVRTEGTLVRRTHEDYCQLCDRVFVAWKKLLTPIHNSSLFLESKANHMAKICKCYGIERRVRKFHFFNEMADTDFIKFTTLCDPLIIEVRAKKWHRAVWLYMKYNAKIVISKYFLERMKK